MVNALRILKIKNVAFASPYVAALNNDAIEFLASQNITTVSRFDYPRDLGNYGQGELQPDEILNFAMQANSPEADAIVLSCTDLRATESIVLLEEQAGKPVITSNQAMMFSAMQALEIKDAINGFGRLFDSLND